MRTRCTQEKATRKEPAKPEPRRKAKSRKTMLAIISISILGGLLLPRPQPLPRVASITCSAATTTFESLNVRPEIVEALAAAGVESPNALQARAIPAINGRADLIIGAQTGSGKTFTYLVPTMGAIKADEDAGAARARPRRPRAIVLVPTRELALQVHGVAKSIAHHAKLSVAVVHGGVPDAPQLRRLSGAPVDLLVATPGRLVKLMELGGLFLGDVRHVVLDEVDTMFDAGFGPELDAVLKVTTRDLSADARADASGAVQHLAVGATHPQSALALYERWLAGARRLMLEGSHALPTQLRQHFLTCNGADECFGVLGVPRGLCLSPWICRACALFTWLLYGDLESERVLAVRCRPVSTKHRSSRVHLLRRGVTLR